MVLCLRGASSCHLSLKGCPDFTVWTGPVAWIVSSCNSFNMDSVSDSDNADHVVVITNGLGKGIPCETGHAEEVGTGILSVRSLHRARTRRGHRRLHHRARRRRLRAGGDDRLRRHAPIRCRSLALDQRKANAARLHHARRTGKLATQTALPRRFQGGFHNRPARPRPLPRPRTLAA